MAKAPINQIAFTAAAEREIWSTTKACFKCGCEKALSEFYPHPTTADGLLGKCKACARRDSLDRRSRRLDLARAYDRTNRRRIRDERRAVWLDYLSRQHCAECGESHIAVLEHHHVDPSQKAFNIADWATRQWSAVSAELAKCVVLCANCHRKIEWAERLRRTA